jgi:hypothetical protein
LIYSILNKENLEKWIVVIVMATKEVGEEMSE